MLVKLLESSINTLNFECRSITLFNSASSSLGSVKSISMEAPIKHLIRVELFKDDILLHISCKIHNNSDALCNNENIRYDNAEMRIMVCGGGSYVFQIGH